MGFFCFGITLHFLTDHFSQHQASLGSMWRPCKAQRRVSGQELLRHVAPSDNRTGQGFTAWHRPLPRAVALPGHSDSHTKPSGQAVAAHMPASFLLGVTGTASHSQVRSHPQSRHLLFWFLPFFWPNSSAFP